MLPGFQTNPNIALFAPLHLYRSRTPVRNKFESFWQQELLQHAWGHGASLTETSWQDHWCSLRRGESRSGIRFQPNQNPPLTPAQNWVYVSGKGLEEALSGNIDRLHQLCAIPLTRCNPGERALSLHTHTHSHTPFIRITQWERFP